MKHYNKVLVIGGGVGGIKAAMDLAETGKHVVLIEKSPSVGGLMTQLDRTFPTNNCDLCTLSPNLAESARKQHIELFTCTTLDGFEEKDNGFLASLKTAPRYIDLEKCTACGECLKAFPECVRFTPGLDHRAPTCMRYPQATPEAFSIDMTVCDDIEALVKVCPAGAIMPNDTEKSVDVEFGSIVLAMGAELFDPCKLADYGYGSLPNVVTGMEYERILSASGPTNGELLRPSDSKKPEKIAWIQCVGSRNLNQIDVPYCSSVCCMYALKEAMVTKEHFRDDIDATVFYMDMRTIGKDYELYYQRAKNEYNVRFVRSRPHTIGYINETDDLVITYTNEDESTIKSESFDMVVLSTGFKIPQDTVELAEKLGIDLNKHNFIHANDFNPVATSKHGIYVCGLSEGPKDIPETMIQASAAAFMASKDIEINDERSEEDVEYVQERDVSLEDPRVGVFLCECGKNIGGVIDVSSIQNYAEQLPDVAVSEIIGHGCSGESLDHIRKTIIKDKLNRIVIGGCSPRTHEGLFQDTVQKAGLNKYLVEIANIRDQVTWVHSNDTEKALIKSQDLIRMAVSGAALSRPLKDHVIEMNQDILVVGGGVTGMNAALNLAEHGYRVYLVEKSRELGGNAKNIRKTIDGENVQEYMKILEEEVWKHDLIQVITNAVIVDHTGMQGMFRTGLQIGPRMYYRQINHGAAIIATGTPPNRPDEYLLNRHKSVFTQLELDAMLEEQQEKCRDWKNVVMIQCVGSRSTENPNCSRICCLSAVKNALRLKELNPENQVYIMYRDMRTFGLYEDYFRQAREKGVHFIRFHDDGKPEVKGNGDQLNVIFKELILGRRIEIQADCLALSTGFASDEEATEDLGVIFRIPRTQDGYFMEDHTKLRPVDLPVPGIFIAGTAHSPRSIRESITQAYAAAGRALTLLSKKVINLGASVAKVDKNKCAACLICVRACPFDIPFINADGYSEIDPAKCHGCGVCAADCPAKAIQLMQYQDDQVMAKVEGLLEGVL